MTNYYIRSINEDGTGEVIAIEMNPICGREHKHWSGYEAAKIILDNNIEDAEPIGIASKELTQSNGVGFVPDPEVRYQVLEPVPPDGDLQWISGSIEKYNKYKDCAGVTRLYLTPKVSAPTQEKRDMFMEQALKCGILMDEARHYLMSVPLTTPEITKIVEDTLEKLGFGRNGYGSNFQV